MSYTVKILPIAYRDARDAKKWYNKQREGLGDEFKVEVNKEIQYIREYPEHYQVRYKQLRQSLVNRFPYLIFYILEEENNRIVILGILHAKRNPELIRKRMDRQ